MFIYNSNIIIDKFRSIALVSVFFDLNLEETVLEDMIEKSLKSVV